MNQIARIPPRIPQPPAVKMPAEQWRVLTDAIFPNAKTAGAICLALDYCAARKLDIFKRPVNIVPMWNSNLNVSVETVWPGINELQVTAARTGQWTGMDEPRWGPVITRTFRGETGRDGQKRKVECTLDYPEWCSVTVYRTINGVKCAFSEPVYWEESYATTGRWSEVPNDMWRKRIRGQLHKNAKAASLRAAFPEEMGNDFTSDEMEGKETDGGVVIEGHAEPATPEPEPAHGDVADDIVLTFAERAEEALLNEPNPTKWLKLLDQLVAEAPTLDDIAHIRGLKPVGDAELKAPTAIKGMIADMWRKATDRLAPQADPQPEVAQEPAAPDDVDGLFGDITDPDSEPPSPNPLIARVERELAGLESSAAINAWAKGPIRPLIVDAKNNDRPTFDLVITMIDSVRANRHASEQQAHMGEGT